MIVFSVGAWIAGVAGSAVAAIIVYEYQRRRKPSEGAAANEGAARADTVEAFLRRLDRVDVGVAYSLEHPEDGKGLDNARWYINEARDELQPVRRARDAALVAHAMRSLDAYDAVVRALRDGDSATAQAHAVQARSERELFEQGV